MFSRVVINYRLRFLASQLCVCILLLFNWIRAFSYENATNHQGAEFTLHLPARSVHFSAEGSVNARNYDVRVTYGLVTSQREIGKNKKAPAYEATNRCVHVACMQMIYSISGRALEG